jgi:hypothetical protein
LAGRQAGRETCVAVCVPLCAQDILLETYAKEFRGDEDVELHIITKEAFEKVGPLH